jgi:hypothetical protein
VHDSNPDKKKKTEFPFVFGVDVDYLCEQCELPCRMDSINLDCYRRFFLRGLAHCSYFVYGYCFLTEQPGCVFDNGGRHESYWLNLLNEYFHNVGSREMDEEFLSSREQVLKLVNEQIERSNVYLCRYLEEYYNRIMEIGGGLSEDMLLKLDEAYLSLLRGIARKTD